MKVLDALSAPPEPSSLGRSVGPAGDEERAELGAFLADDSPEASPTDRAVEALETARARRRLGKAAWEGHRRAEATGAHHRHPPLRARRRETAQKLVEIVMEIGRTRVRGCGRSSALRRRGPRRGARRPGRLSAPKAFVHGSTRRGRFPATAKAPAKQCPKEPCRFRTFDWKFRFLKVRLRGTSALGSRQGVGRRPDGTIRPLWAPRGQRGQARRRSGAKILGWGPERSTQRPEGCFWGVVPTVGDGENSGASPMPARLTRTPHSRRRGIRPSDPVILHFHNFGL